MAGRGDHEINLRVTAQDDASRKLDDIADAVDELDGETTVRVDAETRDAESRIERFAREIDGLTDEAREVRVEFRAQQLERDIRNTLRDLEKLDDPVEIEARTGDLEAAISDLNELKALAGERYSIDLDVDAKRSAREAADDVDRMRVSAEGLQSGVGPLRGFTDELGESAGTAGVAANALIDAGEAVEIFGSQLGISQQTLGKLSLGLGAIGVAVGAATYAWSQYRAAQQRAAEKAEELLGVQEQLADQKYTEAAETLAESYGDLFADLAEKGVSAADAVAFVTGEVETLQGVTGEDLGFETTKSLLELRAGLDAAGTELDRTSTLTGELETALRGGKPAVDASTRSLLDQRSAAADTAREIGSLRNRFRDLADELADRTAYLDIKDQFDRIEVAAAEAWQAAVDGTEDADAKAREYERQQIELKNRVIEFGDEIGGLPDEQVTEILAQIDAGNYEWVESELDRLERERTATILVKFRNAVSGGFDFGGFVPTSQTSTASAVTNNVYLPRAAEARDVTAALTRWERTNG